MQLDKIKKGDTYLLWGKAKGKAVRKGHHGDYVFKILEVNGVRGFKKDEEKAVPGGQISEM